MEQIRDFPSPCGSSVSQRACRSYHSGSACQTTKFEDIALGGASTPCRYLWWGSRLGASVQGRSWRPNIFGQSLAHPHSHIALAHSRSSVTTACSSYRTWRPARTPGAAASQTDQRMADRFPVDPDWRKQRPTTISVNDALSIEVPLEITFATLEQVEERCPLPLGPETHGSQSRQSIRHVPRRAYLCVHQWGAPRRTATSPRLSRVKPYICSRRHRHICVVAGTSVSNAVRQDHIARGSLGSCAGPGSGRQWQ